MKKDVSDAPQREHQPPMRTIVLASGKGGVGKTGVAVNLAVTLAQFDARVTLLDADYALGDVDVMLGLDSERDIGDALEARATLADIAVAGPAGVRIIAASTGRADLCSLSNEQHDVLWRGLRSLRDSTDILLVDSASGISENVLWWLQRATEVVLVTTPEPAARVDAYAVLKLLANLDGSQRRVRLLVNLAEDERIANEIHLRMAQTASAFLGTELSNLGHISPDPMWSVAENRHEALVTMLPASPASRCFRRLARRLMTIPVPREQDQTSARDAIESTPPQLAPVG